MIAFLEGLGIEPPPTYQSSLRMIKYIKQGNGTIGSTVSDRIGIVLGYCKKWVGKRVRAGAEYGTVQYLITKDIAHDWDDIARVKRQYGPNAIVHPFWPHVKWDARTAKQAGFSQLEIISEVGIAV